MSYFGKWKCPKCDTNWVGSIGWVMPEREELDKMLLNKCGCEGIIEGAPDPVGSASVMNMQLSDKRRKQLEEKENANR